MIGMENLSSTGKESGIYSVECRIQDCLVLNTRSYNLYMGQDYKGNNIIISSSFCVTLLEIHSSNFCAAICFLDHNVFLRLKVGVCSTFCNLCCYVKEGKLLPEELFDVTTKGLCVHTTLI